ncbi:Mpo1 family 2-hydroxy fatty acid dioxygenase [Bdellovibrio svalbardensis]|uniref:DUF962 domain-containing protein n=1 Tax=Bdellovibrio svalbardensis TaxID=2972972 RepID=A0ABT6DGK9_9BACT|nr:Mpo1-like protein [Bdellovibrio svalbardensis]MDG0815612.1 DUF962 domain-containing protein [Bdellovibrio svalbardensis]
MKTLEQWFAEYSESHQNPLNRRIHKVCVPAIFFSIVGLLIQIPVNLGPLRLGELVIAIALGWYMTLGRKAFLMMLGQVIASYVLLYILGHLMSPVIPLLLIFVVAWIGQFYGHKVEGKKPSFFKDLQFLLIGPLWVWTH